MIDTTVQEIYDIHPLMNWGLIIVSFPFFTGLSAGSFTLSTLAYVFGRKEYKVVSRHAVLMALVLLFLALLTLMADMTQPTRLLLGYIRPNMTSMFSWATFLVTGYAILSLIYAWFIFRKDDKRAKLLGMMCIPVALGVHADTGFVFGLNKGTPLWHTALMPMLFLVSALTSGIALLVFVTVIMDKFKPKEKKIDPTLIFSMGNMVVFFLVTEAFLLISDVTTMLYSGTDERDAVMLWLTGPLMVTFLGIEVIAGIVIPLLLYTHPKTGKSLLGQAVASALVVIGTYAMRYNVIVGGQTIPKTGSGLVELGETVGFRVYSETADIMIVLGIMITGAIMFALAVKLFPIIVDFLSEKIYGTKPSEQEGH
ncbi:MAG TPA: polysulfide reductase NrfD [Candidatus Methanoperedenaceae archaeon]|nr:polysulfide reductase NrfD [Candidatus Methanoperedenaceae archaeon]